MNNRKKTVKERRKSWEQDEAGKMTEKENIEIRKDLEVMKNMQQDEVRIPENEWVEEQEHFIPVSDEIIDKTIKEGRRLMEELRRNIHDMEYVFEVLEFHRDLGNGKGPEDYIPQVKVVPNDSTEVTD